VRGTSRHRVWGNRCVDASRAIPADSAHRQ
jgi:hypothetical protein